MIPRDLAEQEVGRAGDVGDPVPSPAVVEHQRRVDRSRTGHDFKARQCFDGMSLQNEG